VKPRSAVVGPGLPHQLLHHPPHLFDALGGIGQVAEEAQLVAAVELVFLRSGVNERDEPRRVDRGVGGEEEAPAAGAGLDLLDAVGLDAQLQLGDPQ
jgi:hypothetical protein